MLLRIIIDVLLRKIHVLLRMIILGEKIWHNSWIGVLVKRHPHATTIKKRKCLAVGLSPRVMLTQGDRYTLTQTMQQ